MAMEAWDIVTGGFAFPGDAFSHSRSPRWLMQKGRKEEARTVLQQIGEENVAAELDDMAATLELEHKYGQEHLFAAKNRLPVFLAVSVAMFNQLSGINAILYYLNQIFAQAGFNKVSSDLQAVAIGATNLIFTMIAMTLIDRIGRKKLLLIGAVGTATCLAGVAAIFLTHQHNEYLVWLLVTYIAFFAFS